MSIKLIALDLDGTLLNSEKKITPRTLAAIHEAQAKGVGVTIATGRMFKGAEIFGRQIGANAPLVCCNGGVVEAMGADYPMFARYLEPPVVRRLLQFAHRRGWYLNWYIGNDVLVERYEEDYFYAYRTVKDLPIKEVGDRYLDYTKNVFQCVLRDLSGHVAEKEREIRQQFGTSILAQQNTGCSMECGDGDNDLAMLRYAGTAVVPANGLASAKALATYHTDSNDEDGIAKAIEELVL